MRIGVFIVAGLWASLPLFANESGLPVGSTGAFGERTCAGALCHVPEPLNTGLSAGISIQVGPYVPGATQLILVEILSTSARRWGFQLTARRADDTTQPAGRFAARNFFTAVRCPDGRFGPCAETQVEYATHTSVGTGGGGQSGRKLFAVDWTAPGSDVGDVIFAAAGVAADGNLGGASDLTATTTQLSLHAPTHLPRLSNAGVRHAAALQRETEAIAPKQLLTLFGINFSAPGTFIPVRREDFDIRGHVPEELHRLSVEFRRPRDSTRLGRIVFVGDNQVNLQAPDFPGNLRGAVATIQAVIHRGEGANEIRSNELQFAIAPTSPGLFTLDSSGVGHAAAVDGVSGRLVAPPSAGAPNSIRARPGDVLLVFGSGFGATDPDFAPGELADAARLTSPVSGSIGGVELTQDDVLYAGAAPRFAGLQQFNLRIPSLPDGDHALVLRIGTEQTQQGVFVSVGPR